MSSKVERVLKFFDTELEQYVIGDLTRLSEIRPDQDTGLRGCTIPQAMLVFAILDLLGYLVNEDPAASKKATFENYKVILASKQGLFPEQYEKETDRLVKLFRHGIMHQFFPKASAIAKSSKNGPLIYKSGNKICLNVDKLSNDVLNAIRQIRQRVESGRFNDLAERMNDRLDILAEEDFQDLAKLRKQIIAESKLSTDNQGSCPPMPSVDPIRSEMETNAKVFDQISAIVEKANHLEYRLENILSMVLRPITSDYGHVLEKALHNTGISFGGKLRLIKTILDYWAWDDLQKGMGRLDDVIRIRNAFAHTSMNRRQMTVEMNPATSYPTITANQMIVESRNGNKLERIERGKAFQRFNKAYNSSVALVDEIEARVKKSIK